MTTAFEFGLGYHYRMGEWVLKRLNTLFPGLVMAVAALETVWKWVEDDDMGLLGTMILSLAYMSGLLVTFGTSC